MAQFTVTTSGRTNLPPSQIGRNQFLLDHNEVYTFVLNDFTVNTTPPYLDPEGDAVDKLKVLTLPTIGVLNLNGVPVIINDEITASSIDASLFTYTADVGTETSYVDQDFTFDLSDVGSLIFSSLLTGVITFKVGAKVNLPPSVVGDGTETISYGQTLVFTRAMLTSSLVPPYSDPEGDAAGQLRITIPPENGNLLYAGTVVVSNDIIPFTDIDLGQLVYVPDSGIIILTDIEFSFEIADTGSNQFVG